MEGRLEEEAEAAEQGRVVPLPLSAQEGETALVPEHPTSSDQTASVQLVVVELMALAERLV